MISNAQNNFSRMNLGKITYKRAWPVRAAKAILYLAHKILPRGFYDALYACGRKILWCQQRLIYKVRFAAAKAFCKGDDLERLRLVDLLLPYTMGGPLALESAFDIVSRTESDGLSGALVECGVAKGGCSAMMALTSRYYGKQRNVWLFDSYEGLPAPTQEDFIGGSMGQMVSPLSQGMLVGTIDQVNDLMFKKCNLSQEYVFLVKGWFQDTLPKSKDSIGNIAVLRLDGDWYESTKCCLENLYDHVVTGGFIIIDDYGTCFGAERAVTEFLNERQVNAILVSDGRGGAWFRKTV